jgi:hypothetical protein
MSTIFSLFDDFTPSKLHTSPSHLSKLKKPSTQPHPNLSTITTLYKLPFYLEKVIILFNHYHT